MWLLSSIFSEGNISKSFLENGEYKLYISPKTKQNVTCSGPVLMNDPADTNIRKLNITCERFGSENFSF